MEHVIDVTNERLRRERINLLTKRAKLINKARKKGKANNKDLEQLLNDLQELESLKRIERCQEDILQFMYEYFSDDLNPDNEQNLVPAGVKITDAPEFHRELCDVLNVVSNVDPASRIAWAAPRGHAKSAYLSNCFPIHEIVYRKRKYILILSETDSSSKKFIEWIANQLKFNEKLREDFGDILSPSKRLNDKDNQEAFLTKEGVLVEASSIGKQLRGKRNGPYRPDLVILDDLESQKNTNTKELREKNIHWFNSVVIPIGDPERTAFVYMGTMIHKHSLLSHVLNRSDFHSNLFTAIIEKPERQDLWDEFEQILRNQEDPDRQDNAIKFYEQNKLEMDKGVKVLWDGRYDYCRLMIEKANMGSRAFNSEFQNNPIDEEEQIFKPEIITLYDWHELYFEDGRNRPLTYFGAWDIAMGKNNRSDYNAILIVARDRSTGIIYVVDAWAKKCPAHEALEEVINKLRKYRPKMFAVETVAAQHDLYRQLRQRLPKEGIYGTRLKPVMNRTKKEERIESLEPYFENGALRVHRTQRLLREQLEEFPNGDNDDLPDALQMAVELAARMGRRSYYNKPAGL